MNFFRSVLFHMKTGGYRKYFVRGCRIPDNVFLVHMVRKVPHWITSQLQRFLDLRMLSKPRYKWWYLETKRGNTPSPCPPPCPRPLAVYLQQTTAKNIFKQSSIYRFTNLEIRVNFWWALWTIFKSEVAMKSTGA